MKQEVYIDVRHDNFWWGVYGFTEATDWEDFDFYEKKADDFVRIGSICVCSRRYLEDGLAGLEEDPDEKDFAVKVKQFLAGNTFAYHYCYEEPDSEDFYEVPFEAERNEKGIKPCYVEMWYPRDGIDMQAAEACTIEFYDKFLHKHVDAVLLKDIPSFEQKADTYREDLELFSQGPVQIRFSDELIANLEKQWNMSEEQVRKKLQRMI